MMEDNVSNNLKIIRLMNGTHGYTAERLKSVVSNESLLSDYTNGKKNVSDYTARGIEQVLELPNGWLERDNLSIINTMSKTDFELVKKLINIPKEAKDGLYQFINKS
jgi:hypothetical protein